MDRLKIEQLAKEIVELKNQKLVIVEKEKRLRTELFTMLKSDNKNYFVFGDYAIEIKKKYIKTLKKEIEATLPKDSFSMKIIEQMFIKRKQDIELIGNKFVVRKKDGV